MARVHSSMSCPLPLFYAVELFVSFLLHYIKFPVNRTFPRFNKLELAMYLVCLYPNADGASSCQVLHAGKKHAFGDAESVDEA